MQQQSRRIHELVELSRDRVAHVRAGQSLLDVLDATTQPAAATTQRGLFPPPAASALVSQQRVTFVNSNSNNSNNASDTGGLRAVMRKRAAVVLRAPTLGDPAARHGHGGAAPALSSSEQFAVYAGSKLTQSGSLNMLERRKAVPLAAASSSKQLAKLVAQHEAATKERDKAASPVSPLLQAVAAVKGRNAFLKLKQRAVQRAPTREAARNTHMAFLEFRASASRGERAPPENDLAQLNASTREPLRFGDAVCLISLASNLPLAIGHHGRTVRVRDAVAGPHMVFTLVDFRNPSRRDDVLVGEPFWLRVDASHLDVGEPDEILALLVDTHYYLGGPGPLEDDEEEEVDERGVLRGSLRKYATRTATASDGPRRRRRPDDQSFKLVALKASVPSAEYYGDDAATREYAVETNAKVMRLAQWRFAAASVADNNNERRHRHHHRKSTTAHRRRRRAGGDDSDRSDHEGSDNSDRGGGDDSDRNDPTSGQLVLNCACVGLTLGELGELALEFDAQRRRGVLRGSLTRAEESEPRAAPRVERRESCAWQVRLMKRGDPPPPLPPPGGDDASSPSRRTLSPSNHKQKPPPPPSSPVGKRRPPTQQESFEWLQFHRDRVEREAKRVDEKRALAREAHAVYDSVAARSNAKLLQIENNKAVHHREYFQSRFQQVVEARERRKHVKTTTLPRI